MTGLDLVDRLAQHKTLGAAPREELARLAGELSPRDLAILTDVARLRLVSTRQIERLHFTATEQTSRRLAQPIAV